MVSAHCGGWETPVDGLRLPCAGAGSGAAGREREPADASWPELDKRQKQSHGAGSRWPGHGGCV